MLISFDCTLLSKKVDEDAGSTCTECEEEELNLLAFWKQLNEVKLEGNHGNAVLRG